MKRMIDLYSVCMSNILDVCVCNTLDVCVCVSNTLDVCVCVCLIPLMCVCVSTGFTWDALLKYSDITLELLTDIDQHLFVEKGLRGGVSMVSHRYARANKPADGRF